MITMESFVTRKQSLEEEISLCEWMLAYEHRKEMRNKIRTYMDQINRELLSVLR